MCERGRGGGPCRVFLLGNGWVHGRALTLSFTFSSLIRDVWQVWLVRALLRRKRRDAKESDGEGQQLVYKWEKRFVGGKKTRAATGFRKWRSAVPSEPRVPSPAERGGAQEALRICTHVNGRSSLLLLLLPHAYCNPKSEFVFACIPIPACSGGLRTACTPG
jgi:hypothetical protein